MRRYIFIVRAGDSNPHFGYTYHLGTLGPADPL